MKVHACPGTGVQSTTDMLIQAAHYLMWVVMRTQDFLQRPTRMGSTPIFAPRANLVAMALAGLRFRGIRSRCAVCFLYLASLLWQTDWP